MIWLAALLWFSSQSNNRQDLVEAARAAAEAHKQVALQINELAGHIKTEADAQKLTELVDKALPGVLPDWGAAEYSQRVALAEYLTATDTGWLIPEQRLADVWNEYVREIGAPKEAEVSTGEIHNLRDGLYSSAQAFWSRGYQQIWTIPSIYATGPNGKVAGGCRVFETLRVLYDLHRWDNLQSTRERMKKGDLASGLTKKAQVKRTATASWIATSEARPNPVDAAEHRYIEKKGMLKFDLLRMRLFDRILPESAR